MGCPGSCAAVGPFRPTATAVRQQTAATLPTASRGLRNGRPAASHRGPPADRDRPPAATRGALETETHHVVSLDAMTAAHWCADGYFRLSAPRSARRLLHGCGGATRPAYEQSGPRPRRALHRAFHSAFRARSRLIARWTNARRRRTPSRDGSRSLTAVDRLGDEFRKLLRDARHAIDEGILWA
jgi:hypothetical protein